MATLMNNSSGNFSTAATWSLIDSTSLLDSEAASTGSTTSWVSSQTFVPGAIVIDGLAIKVLSHNNTGTFSVRLGRAGSITSNTLANPTVVTTPANHGLQTGQAIVIAGSNSTPSINGAFNVTVLSDTTFSIPVNVTVAGTAGTWNTVLSTITSNTSAASTVCTSTAHGLSTGQSITITGSTSSPSLNGTYTVTVLTANTFSIPVNTTSGFVTGAAVYNIDTVDNSVVSINASDLNTTNTATNNGFIFFKFPSSLTLKSGATYSVQISGTSGGNVTCYRNATAANWSRALRTTTTQAPAAADILYVCGEFVSPASNSSLTVTMNSTSSATSYGDIQIADKGVLAYGTAASTNYYLKLAGNILGYTGGTYSQGTSGTPIPTTSTAKLEFACTSNVQYGYECRTGHIMNTGGAVITNKALLAADAAATATSLTTDVSTGWLSGDVIAVASTTRTRAECESKALTANASGTTLTITALTNAHGGTAPIVAELANLTRNNSIFSTSTTNQTYINLVGAAVVNLQSTEFYNMGSATASKRGIDVGITTGSCTINNCSIHDFNVTSSLGINCNSASNNNLTITNNVLYNISNNGVTVSSTTGTNYTYNNLLCILSGASCFNFSDVGGTITNITAVGGLTRGTIMTGTDTLPFGASIGNFISHSNTGPGFDLTNLTGIRYPQTSIDTITSWRNTTNGITISNAFNFILAGTITLFGNATANINYSGSAGNTFIRNVVSNAGTVLTCPVGVSIGSDIKECYIDNSTFGATTTHSTGDISIPGSNVYPRLYLRNCSLNSATPVATVTNMIDGGRINSARHQQTSGNHRVFQKYGTISSDTTIYNRAAPSVRVTPSSASFSIIGDVKKVAVPSGQTVKINVFLRKSVAGDGAAYNGAELRLIQRADSATGNMTDTVLATTDATYNGVFKLLSATTAAATDDCVLTFFVDGSGTAGFFSLDDWSVDS